MKRTAYKFDTNGELNALVRKFGKKHFEFVPPNTRSGFIFKLENVKDDHSGCWASRNEYGHKEISFAEAMGENEIKIKQVYIPAPADGLIAVDDCDAYYYYGWEKAGKKGFVDKTRPDPDGKYGLRTMAGINAGNFGNGYYDYQNTDLGRFLTQVVENGYKIYQFKNHIDLLKWLAGE